MYRQFRIRISKAHNAAVQQNLYGTFTGGIDAFTTEARVDFPISTATCMNSASWAQQHTVIEVRLERKRNCMACCKGD
jgi:hypothetical protein